MNQEPKRGTFAKEKGEVILREHEYDGIQEYDQKLPNWWLFTFYGAIVWFVIHWLLYYQFPIIRTDHENLTQALGQIQDRKAAELEKTLASLDDSTLVHEWASKPEIVAAGKETYSKVCSTCHGADMSATMMAGTTRVPLPGVPLNDGKWTYGGKPLQIFKMVNEGSPPGSKLIMPAKGGANLTSKQVAEVVSYLISQLPGEFSAIAPKQ